MLTALKQYANDFLHLIYPHICIGCGDDVIENDELICAKCFAGLPVTDYFLHENNPMQKRFAGRIAVQHAAGTFHFTTKSVIQNIMFAMKYRGNKEAGIFLGKQTGKALLQTAWYNDIDAIVPLPLNSRRLKQRGYNQAALIANGIGAVLGKPVIENAALRKIYTETQTHKSRISRWQNMQFVFTINNTEKLQGKHILLVDDIVTTGATLEACGQMIAAIPGTRLSIAAAACTI